MVSPTKLALLLSLLLLSTPSEAVTTTPQKKPVNTPKLPPAVVPKNDYQSVRVLLTAVTGVANLTIISPAGFCVKNAQGGTIMKNELSEVHIKANDGLFFVNDTRIKGNSATIIPGHHEFVFQGRTYHGSCQLLSDQKRLLLINVVPLEEYVSSVLRTESWPGWPLEVNKVFAIASRSYVLALMERAAKKNKLYHIKSTNQHQTYKGVHGCDIIKEAVSQTRGMFLVHEGKPIIAMFDCCCGGIIPAHLEGVDFENAPYLARTYACQHCKQCKIYRWQAEFEPPALYQHLLKHVPHVGVVYDVSVGKKDKAGVVKELSITGKRWSTHTVPGQEVHKIIKEAKSLCFDISKQKGKIIFSGRGYGHHLGLCQWGAREMVRDNWSYKRILQFFYPGTTFAKLNL